MWSQEEIDKSSNDYQTRSWKMSDAAQNREKQEWKNEKPKLDNVRQMKVIYFIDPDDEEYKEILKNPRRKLERSMAPIMPCRKSHSKRFKKRFVVVESHETRQRANFRVLETISLREGGLKQSRIVEDGFFEEPSSRDCHNTYGDGRTQCVHVSGPK